MEKADAMRTREATREDVPTLVRLLAEDDLGSRRESTGDGDQAVYLAAMDAISRDPNNRVLVGLRDDVIVCMLQLTYLPHLTFRGGWRAQIEGVRVAAGCRGEGLGRELVTAAIAMADEHGCHLVQLTTNKARREAVRFYESVGFEPTHEGMKLYLEGAVSS